MCGCRLCVRALLTRCVPLFCSWSCHICGVVVLLDCTAACPRCACRDAFRALLAKHREEGIINAHTRWKVGKGGWGLRSGVHQSYPLTCMPQLPMGLCSVSGVMSQQPFVQSPALCAALTGMLTI